MVCFSLILFWKKLTNCREVTPTALCSNGTLPCPLFSCNGNSLSTTRSDGFRDKMRNSVLSKTSISIAGPSVSLVPSQKVGILDRVDRVTEAAGVTTTISKTPSKYVTRTSASTPLGSSLQSGSSAPKHTQGDNALWTGARIGLGVCIPLMVILVLALLSLLLRKMRRSRIASTVSGSQQGTTEESQATSEVDERNDQKNGWETSRWETKRHTSNSTVSIIEVRGSLHRLPTILRPGSTRMSWRPYNPYSLDVDISPRDMKWGGK